MIEKNNKGEHMTYMKYVKLFKIHGMRFFKVICVAIFFFIGTNAYGGMETYQIKYHKDSKIQNVSLVNIELLIELHRVGKAIGRLISKTDNAQNITIDNIYGDNLIIHILSINKDGKKIRCWGVSTPKISTIEIKCDDKKLLIVE
jgi:hypothetical protein